MGLKFAVGEKAVAVPNGEYKVILEEATVKKGFGKDTLHLNFRIADGKYHGALCRGFVNVQHKKFSSRSKLWQWAEVILGHTPEDEIEVDDFKDRLLLAEIQTNESNLTKNKFPNVMRILKLIQEL